jgi:hypothetical protein
MIIRLSTSALRDLRDQIDAYIEAVDTSGLSDDNFNGHLAGPPVNDGEPVQEVNLALSFANSRPSNMMM